MVYPSATHTRFEHSLGVMHLASQFYEIITHENKSYLENKLHYDEAGFRRDGQLVRLAALLHDIGHTPFSHAGENKKLMKENPETNRPYKHEHYSVEVIKNVLRDVIEKHDVNQNYKISADEVAGLIEGNGEVLGWKIFWKQLISGQLDADRCDYLLRDSHHTGVKYGIYDVSRLIATITIAEDPETEEPILAIDESGWHVAESLILSRYYMFTQVYFHRTRRAYDFHLSRALESILPNGKFPEPQKIAEFLELDDWVISKDILTSSNDDCRRIRERRHIRCIYETPEVPNNNEVEKFEKAKDVLGDLVVYEDLAKSKWYEVNGESSTMEIFIKLDGKIMPLSKISRIVPKMGEMRQRRLYVYPESKDKARKLLEKEGLL